MKAKPQKEKIAKTRISIYLPEHQAQIAVWAFGSKSAFVTAAIDHFINDSNGMKKYFKQFKEKVSKHGA